MCPWEDEPALDLSIEKITLCRDDFIEWVLRYTNEDSEFRVWRGKHYIGVGIDTIPFIE